MKRLLSLIVSLGILGILYARLDFHAVLRALQACDPIRLGLSLAMVIPLTLLTAWRFRQIAPCPERLRLIDATQLILAASTLNLVLPSKMGDVAKAFFLASDSEFSRSEAFALVLFEKAFDLLSLLIWCLLALLVMPKLVPPPVTGAILALTLLLAGGMASTRFLDAVQRLLARCLPNVAGMKLASLFDSARSLQKVLRANPKKTVSVATQSLLLWFLHLMQIWGFTLALGASVPVLSQLAFAALSILSGLLPFTFAGVGTRDAAAIVLYADYLLPQTAAALGLLMTSRYLIPGIAGVPFLSRYMRNEKVKM